MVEKEVWLICELHIAMNIKDHALKIIKKSSKTNKTDCSHGAKPLFHSQHNVSKLVNG